MDEIYHILSSLEFIKGPSKMNNGGQVDGSVESQASRERYRWGVGTH